MEKKDLHLEEKLEKRIEETEKHLEERREHIQERKEIVHEHYEEINKQLATKSFKEILMGTFSIKEDTAGGHKGQNSIRWKGNRYEYRYYELCHNDCIYRSYG